MIRNLFGKKQKTYVELDDKYVIIINTLSKNGMPVDENTWIKIAVRPVEVVNGISSAFIRSVGYLSDEAVKNDINGKFLKEIK